MTTYYMHTLNDKPAAFDGAMICFMRTLGAAKGNVLATSLNQIRAEQKASNEYRAQNHWDWHEYGHVRVHLPEKGKA